MASLGWILVAVVVVAISWIGLRSTKVPPLPELTPEPWWSTKPKPTFEDVGITQFQVDFPEQVKCCIIKVIQTTASNSE